MVYTLNEDNKKTIKIFRKDINHMTLMPRKSHDIKTKFNNFVKYFLKYFTKSVHLILLDEYIYYLNSNIPFYI